VGSDDVVCSEITRPYVPCFPLAEFLWWPSTKKTLKTENRKPPGRQGAGVATFNAGAYPVDSVGIPFNALFSPDWNDLTAAQGTPHPAWAPPERCVAFRILFPQGRWGFFGGSLRIEMIRAQGMRPAWYHSPLPCGPLFIRKSAEGRDFFTLDFFEIIVIFEGENPPYKGTPL